MAEQIVRASIDLYRPLDSTQTDMSPVPDLNFAVRRYRTAEGKNLPGSFRQKIKWLRPKEMRLQVLFPEEIVQFHDNADLQFGPQEVAELDEHLYENGPEPAYGDLSFKPNFRTVSNKEGNWTGICIVPQNIIDEERDLAKRAIVGFYSNRSGLMDYWGDAPSVRHAVMAETTHLRAPIEFPRLISRLGGMMLLPRHVVFDSWHANPISIGTDEMAEASTLFAGDMGGRDGYE